MTAYSDRGFCYLCLEEYDKAVSDLEKALESDQNHVHPHFGEHYYLEAYKNLGAYYLQIGEEEKAKGYFQAGLELAEVQCLDKMTVAKEIEGLLSQL
jgi:tetratricopeptide (TPR) repeat protein